jgi:hypothetical protein
MFQDEIQEDVYHDQMKLMDDLLFLLRALDDKTNSRVLGAVTATDFEGMMRDYFHSKPEEQILEMLTAVEEDLLVKAPTQWEQKVRREARGLGRDDDDKRRPGPPSSTTRGTSGGQRARKRPAGWASECGPPPKCHPSPAAEPL